MSCRQNQREISEGARQVDRENSKMLDDQQLLSDYCRKFYGYGTWDSKIWLIGMEEGGAGSATEPAIKKRLELWKRRGAKDLENAPEFYGALEYATEWFGKRPKLQSTWRQLIRVLFYSNAIEATRDSIRFYQAQKWGRPECEAAIFEMFALPAGNSQVWPYPSFTDAPFLRSRDSYVGSFLNCRADCLRKKIEFYQPRSLICYGTTYKEYFERIICQHFRQTSESDIKKASFGQTNCFLIYHPTKKGVTNAYFEKVGKFIAGGRS